LKVPHGTELADLRPMLAVFSSYVLSFVYVGIYWNNHHHMLHAARQVNGRILWANLHLLFWLSLVPFATAWMGENRFAETPVALYGGVLLMAGCAYFLLARSLVAHHGADSALAKALGADVKGKVSVGLYAVAIPLSFVATWAALAIYVAVALSWLVPDRRIEEALVD
jgi:uncharacterized membrane protein